MKIGIAYDLREDYLAEGFSDEETAEFDRADTVEAIESSLQAMSFETDRIGHVRSLVESLASGQRWDLVFNIAEGMKGYGREAQVPAILDAYGIPYTFSDPLVLALSLHKGMAKHVIRDLGIPTPDFCTVETEREISSIRLPFPLFVKPVAEGTGKGIRAASRVSTPAELLSVASTLLRQFMQPVLVETFLPGREFTVGIAGTGNDARPLGVMEVLLKDNAEGNAYSYANKKDYEDLVEYRLVSDPAARKAVDVAMAAWNGLGCRDAGRVDLRSDAAGIPAFIEVNPLAGLHPVHSDLPILCRLAGIGYRELIGMIIESASKRFSR